MAGMRVYVGGLPNNTKEQDLEHFFEGFGILKQIIIRKNFAFVEFDDKKHAEDAIFEKDGQELLGVRVTVQMARSTTKVRYNCSEDNSNASGGKKNGPSRTEYRMIVQNLSPSVSWQSLKDVMRQAAPVVYADVNRRLPNEAIVEFASYSGMKVAIEKLDGTELYGRQIHLVEDVRSTSDCLSVSSRSRSRTLSADSDSSPSESCIESRSITLSPYSDSGRSRSFSRSRSRSSSRTLSARSDISSDSCFSSRRRCISVCSESYSQTHGRSRSRTVSAYSNTSCGISLFRSRSLSLPGHSLSIGSRPRTVSAFSDGCNRISRSSSRTLSANSNGSRSDYPGNSRSFREIGPKTSSTCSSRSRSRSRSWSRFHLDELNVDMFSFESCRPSRPSRFSKLSSRSRPTSANASHHESRSRSRKKARKRPGSRSHSAIPAKRFLLDEFL